jgi:lipopolysaccharide transport system ATP-binding protein
VEESSEIVLSVKHLSKFFNKSRTEKIMALDDISFDLKKGEILGIIGKNGSGKSTLLKILSKITGPSEGTIEYEGILTSIIEIGTGFHSDLSGRENVFLGASLMGLSKEEVENKYSEIVEFSGLSDFMKMPVKHYSSGMYLRLAFSVAFHSPIDILLLDEVIAVGDIDFRRKCFHKINELKSIGVSIVLVSHQMDPIMSFCDRCVLMNAGKIEAVGEPLAIVEQYIDLNQQNLNSAVGESLKMGEDISLDATSNAQFKNISHELFSLSTLIVTTLGTKEAVISMNDDILISLSCCKKIDDGGLEVMFYLVNSNGVKVLMDSYGLREDYDMEGAQLPKGNYKIESIIPKNLLNRGIYMVGIVISSNGKFLREIEHAASFKINPSLDSLLDKKMSSVIRPHLDWTITEIIETSNK